MVVRVWKCRSVRKSIRSADGQKRGDVVNVQLGIVLAGHDQQVLGQRQLPGRAWRWRRSAVPAAGARGHRGLALAADGQEQRMNSGRIDGVDRVDAVNHGGDDRAGQRG